MNSPEPLSDQSRNTRSVSGRSPEEIEGEIDRTRAELERTLNALQSKLAPRTLAGRGGLRPECQPAGHAPDEIDADAQCHDHDPHGSHPCAGAVSPLQARHIGRPQACAGDQCLPRAGNSCAAGGGDLLSSLAGSRGSSEVLDKSTPEHDQIRALIQTLHTMNIGDTAYDDTVRKLMRTVLHHVADEESTLLPQAEAMMAGQLVELGARMTKRRIELLRPHLGEVAMTTARSFPVETSLVAASVAASVVALSWLILRPSRRDRHSLL